MYYDHLGPLKLARPKAEEVQGTMKIGLLPVTDVARYVCLSAHLATGFLEANQNDHALLVL